MIVFAWYSPSLFRGTWKEGTALDPDCCPWTCSLVSGVSHKGSLGCREFTSCAQPRLRWPYSIKISVCSSACRLQLDSREADFSLGEGQGATPECVGCKVLCRGGWAGRPCWEAAAVWGAVGCEHTNRRWPRKTFCSMVTWTLVEACVSRGMWI